MLVGERVDGSNVVGKRVDGGKLGGCVGGSVLPVLGSGVGEDIGVVVDALAVSFSTTSDVSFVVGFDGLDGLGGFNSVEFVETLESVSL